MTRFRFSLCCVLAVSVGCKKDATFTEPIASLSAVHWMEAVPDTMSMDLHPIDIVWNDALFDAPFRTATMYYRNIPAGDRHMRVFLSGPDPVNASTVILDTTVSFTASNAYTVIHAGFARTGTTPAHTLWVVPDGAVDPGAGNIGLRVLNAGAGMPNVDVNFTRHAADTLPDVPAVANLAYKGIATYFTVARDSVAADQLRIVATAVGTKTPVLFSVTLPRGLAGDSTKNPIAGTAIAGSVITAVIVPASVIGSKAPQGGAFAAPSAVFLVDKRPPNTMK